MDQEERKLGFEKKVLALRCREGQVKYCAQTVLVNLKLLPAHQERESPGCGGAHL